VTHNRNILDAGERGAIAQAVVVASSFALLLAGTNAVNPLLPVYRQQLGLDPFLISLTFVSYVSVLVVVLLILARPRFTRHAAPVLVAGLTLAIVSDLFLAGAAEWSILLGRAVSGVAGGLATGAASALVVAAVGGVGRALSATGNLVGAVLGTAASQLVVSLHPEVSPQVVVLAHAAIVFVLLCAATVVLVRRRAPNRRALDLVADGPPRAGIDARAVRMLATGCVGWVGVSVALVFGSTVFADLQMPVTRTVGPALMLGVSAAAQLLSPALARVQPRGTGLIVLAFGAGGIAAGATSRVEPVALIGFALLGVGVGVSYRAGLVALTRGTTPARQGALSSLYAAITYAAAAVAVLVVGGLGNVLGIVPAVVGGICATGLAAIAALLWAPRLRDTVDRAPA
jgi:MFS family permease